MGTTRLRSDVKRTARVVLNLFCLKEPIPLNFKFTSLSKRYCIILANRLLGMNKSIRNKTNVVATSTGPYKKTLDSIGYSKMP